MPIRKPTPKVMAKVKIEAGKCPKAIYLKDVLPRTWENQWLVSIVTPFFFEP